MLEMAARRFDILDNTNRLYELCNVHHTLGVPHYTADPLSPFEGTFHHVKRVEGDVSRTEPMYVLTPVQHDDVISDVFAWHTGDPASRTGHIHAYLQPPDQSAITKPMIQTINC